MNVLISIFNIQVLQPLKTRGSTATLRKSRCVFSEYPSIHELLEALVSDSSIHYVLVDTFNGFHSSVVFEKKGNLVNNLEDVSYTSIKLKISYNS